MLDMEIYGYKRSYLNTFITWIAIVASGFLIRLIFYWRPQWMLYATYIRCSLQEAEKVLLIDKYNQYFVEQIQYLIGAPHPATLIHKAQFHQPDEDEILRCPDELNKRHGKPSYGSLISRQNSRSDEGFVEQTSKDLAIEFSSTSNNNDQTSIKFSYSDDEQTRKIRFFENKKIRFIWDDDEGNFVRLRGFDKNVTLGELQTMTGGLNRAEQWKRLRLYGENAIHVEVQSYFRILFEEVLGPFYIFQLFSITVWFNDNYYYYGTCIIFMSVLSLVSGVIQIRRNQKQLRDTVESVDCVKVCRGQDSYEEVESSQLVPGDVVVVPTFNSVLQYDAVLINGNVIVNESMLTGESVPVTKTPLPFNNQSTKDQLTYYDEKEHSKHTLFSGTKVMQTRYYGGVYVKALVIRVGFQTSKGELIRSIMFPKPVDFKFNRQIHKFIGVLACLASMGFIYSVILKTQHGAEFKEILISALDLITIVIPPALPAAMTIGIIYAQSRLTKNKIFCTSPRSINISGCIDCVCFDKTGTLTEDNLSFNEVVPLIEDKCNFGRPFDEKVMQASSKQVERENQLLLDNGDYSPLMLCLASCHSLTIIDQNLIGDPLDLQMFEATGWVLEEPDVEDETKFDLLAPTVVRPPKHKRRTPADRDLYGSSDEFPSSGSDDEISITGTNGRIQNDVGILRQFPFSSSLQRMSVITRQFSGAQYVVYAKGAPEKIASLCDPDTLPANFSEVLHGYTRKGFRVLALAYRPLKVGLSYTRMQRDSRQEIEKDLRFLGLLTLGNLLKPETIPVIDTLNKACLRSVMVTGDNMLTAISVAKECGMITSQDKTIILQVEKKGLRAYPDEESANKFNNEAKTHLALTGETWDFILENHPDLVNSVCVRGTVFARMAPHQKQQLVEQLQALQYYVGMCGDGANDSGALRAAHAGISLSDTEASVAAPFTSGNTNIACVPKLISEGRAALVTAFGILKYMAMYSLVQFCSVLLLYTMYTNFTDIQFMYEDLFIIATLVTLFGRTEPYPSLGSKPPSSSLLSVAQLSSVSIQLALVVFFQVLSMLILWQNPWYESHPPISDHQLGSHDNYAIFAMSSFQCISLAVVFSKGKPYRKSIVSNYLLTGALILLSMLTVAVLIIPAEWEVPIISLDVTNVPIEFRIIMLCLAFTHFVAAMIGECFIVDHIIFKEGEKLLELFGGKPTVTLYQTIDRKTRSTNWLPMSMKGVHKVDHTN